MSEEEAARDAAPPAQISAPQTHTTPPVPKQATLNGETVVDTTQAGPR
jgi:hypothetical protein